MQKGRKRQTCPSLNIKHPEAHRVARAIAAVTGEKLTEVVLKALRERYARLEEQRSKASVSELLAIADRAAAHVRRPYVTHGELMYDEDGLPK